MSMASAHAARRPELPAHDPRPHAAPTALPGPLVIDFSRVVAGPICTQLLADLGARVIKIENPAGGDDMRHVRMAALGGESAAFLAFNRGKRSVALDLSRPEGRDVALALVRQADVLVENFSTGVMERLGLGYDAVAASNPRLVYCSISAYGRSGTYARRSGYDPVVQAESGLMSLNGFADGPPVRMGPPMIDISTGMMACNAVLAALLAREHTGLGQHAEVALFDNAAAISSMFGMSHLMNGETPTRFGQAPEGAAPVGLFQAADGPFYLTCVSDRLYRRLVVDVLARPDLADDPRFATNHDRATHRAELQIALDGIFATRSRAEWMARLQDANVPAGPVRTVAEAFASPEMIARGIASDIPHPSAGAIPNIAPPFRFSRTPTADPVAAPLLGQHTRTVLAELLGYDEARLNALAACGVFGNTTRQG
ncbi:CaiB/BaiF CoA transferase family protein [Vineibacter terrae]|nr:CoA transferase [Vineibacter terrae]